MRRRVLGFLAIVVLGIVPNVLAADRIVVLDGAPVGTADSLFAGDTVVTRVETVVAADPLQSVDAVIFGPTRTAAATSLTPSLLANGTTVAVMAPHRPDGPWPWKQMKDGWVARYDVVGPSRLTDSSIYDAVSLGPVGRPPAMRRQIVLLALLFALAAVGATLLRRRAVWAVVAVSVISTVGIVAWGQSQPTVVVNRVNIVITTGGIEQLDEWMFQRSPVPTSVAVTGGKEGWPVPRSPLHAQRAKITITGLTATYHLDRELPMAVLRRTLRPTIDEDWAYSAVTPNLRRSLARYESADVHFMGMTRASDGTPTIWLTRQGVEAGRTTPPATCAAEGGRASVVAWMASEDTMLKMLLSLRASQ